MIGDALDERLDTILQVDEIALQVKGGQGNRYQWFTRDIIHKMVLSVCADIYSDPRLIMFYHEHFQ